MDSLHCGSCFAAFYTTRWLELYSPARVCPACGGTLELDAPAPVAGAPGPRDGQPN